VVEATLALAALKGPHHIFPRGEEMAVIMTVVRIAAELTFLGRSASSVAFLLALFLAVFFFLVFRIVTQAVAFSAYRFDPVSVVTSMMALALHFAKMIIDRLAYFSQTRQYLMGVQVCLSVVGHSFNR
jgi:hypothetical protein